MAVSLQGPPGTWGGGDTLGPSAPSSSLPVPWALVPAPSCALFPPGRFPLLSPATLPTLPVRGQAVELTFRKLRVYQVEPQPVALGGSVNTRPGWAWPSFLILCGGEIALRLSSHIRKLMPKSNIICLQLYIEQLSMDWISGPSDFIVWAFLLHVAGGLGLLGAGGLEQGLPGSPPCHYPRVGMLP